jgi:hypothetical protein
MSIRKLTRPSLLITGAAIVAASVFASMAFGGDPTPRTVAAQPCGDRIFGHLESLENRGADYQLRFDPALFTSGVTANSAAAEDGAVEPGQPVPNDNYVVDESHRLLTYLVPADTPVTILTRDGDPQQLGATPSTVSELGRIVNGGDGRDLFEPLDSGVWIRVHIDTVCSIDQQYRP